ncbi:hypothetical protein HG263_08325 [Pseudoalteromonas sp. JBTF-M23]|uniref:Uncharacterized protein n=1 Tax=Pseudoalteromonas caenipelagi TaxID=2726988 RepID=A0A849VB81_9GAMM|nr:hypothetical protein [Pseudoalteromonas caenipelagi]NOU50546.1 hypothetical protein [Pseudoalteromonas caenipelagi]
MVIEINKLTMKAQLSTHKPLGHQVQPIGMTLKEQDLQKIQMLIEQTVERIMNERTWE